jgi:protein SMG6
VALIAAQKYLLCLGDLSRYKEQVCGTTNYGRARQHYQKANNLDMRNGRPFNMLAILAKLGNRKFEAVYYHVRYVCSKGAKH